MRQPGDLFYIKVRRDKNLICTVSDCDGNRPNPRANLRVPGQTPIIYLRNSRLFPDIGVYYVPNGQVVEVVDSYVSKEPMP